MEGEALARIRTRTRHVYDERRDEDDMEGVEDVKSSLGITFLYRRFAGTAPRPIGRHQSAVYRGVDSE